MATSAMAIRSSDARDNTASGVVALLDLPIGTSVTMDGHALILKRNDFVGFDHVPSLVIQPGSSHSIFHVITVRAASAGRTTTNSDSGQQPSFGVTVGFVVMPNSINCSAGWIFARRYDPKTEEVSSIPVDKATESNLLQSMLDGQIEPQRVISYDRILKPIEAESWMHQTNYISLSLLKQRGLESGDKIVPGSYEPDNFNEKEKTLQLDGASVSYPPIPFVDSEVAKKTRHVGTKRYLALLSPHERTALFVSDIPANLVLQHILKQYYSDNWMDLLGDVQLSFVLFLHLQCLSSLEHWRDLLSMLSLVQADEIKRQSALYAGLLRVLSHQVSSMEKDFFEDVEYSGDNFFVPAVQRLCSVCSNAMQDERVRKNLACFVTTISNRFPTVFSDGAAQAREEEGNMDSVEEENESVEVNNLQNSGSGGIGQNVVMQTDLDDDSDDDSGPVIVPNEEVEASLARSSEQKLESRYPVQEYSQEYRKAYPLLFASLTPQEDILMACARILDEASDVSLVRQAAAYLEEVESNKMC